MRTLALTLLLVASCATDPSVPADCTPGDLTCDPVATGKADGTTTSGMPFLPAPGGTGALSPWGGTDATRWRPEAIMANAASQALNEAWSRSGVTDAIVAMPMHMLNSSFNEFGDGQSNVAPSFQGWTDSRPPVVATLLRLSGGMKLVLLADHALPNSDTTWDASYTVNGQTKTASLPITRKANGDGVAEWDVPSELGWDDPRSTQVVFVHPHTWGDWFPLMFRFPVKSISSFKSEVLPGFQTFADGGDDQDHEGVSAQTHTGLGTPFERLSSHTFSSAYNQNPYMPSDIHAIFPMNGHNYVTGVGMGWTWVANVPQAPFKIMYTCFDKRNPGAEASAPDGGVPSGGGWHRIGDNAETVLNDLEGGPIVLGSALADPANGSTPTGGFSYGLNDVATVRWVKPGEAFVTPKALDQHFNYHWYFFANPKPVCTEEWVHPCRPTNYGFACDDKSAVTFRVDNATTTFGQNVYVAGDAAELGQWSQFGAFPLQPTAYPTWTGTVFLPRNTTINYKFIERDGTGNAIWQSGANTAFTVPDAATSSTGGTWQ
jgi:hypothetical protein